MGSADDAHHHDPARPRRHPAGHGVAIVAWLVRVGLILAPAVVGAAADAWGLAEALVIPLAAGIVIVLAGPLLTGVRHRFPVARPASHGAA